MTRDEFINVVLQSIYPNAVRMYADGMILPMLSLRVAEYAFVEKIDNAYTDILREQIINLNEHGHFIFKGEK